ncbi:phosphoribosylformylglycinamidine synthase [Aureivirga sp. CE67]|uniref:phosphoribosylformylglycinamidine synthase n=1 Tax=Aureivirga sp. CE67 TaxID=1788983 RepID=UPI0018C9C1C8|nr:phosphoribosylformylglycinamidine synthase [Aureivirga sp. CE67]
MIVFFKSNNNSIFALESKAEINNDTIQKLSWLFGNATHMTEPSLEGFFVGPRKEMVTPWSTNAVEITQNMDIHGIERIEEYKIVEENEDFDPMLEAKYHNLDQEIFTVHVTPEPILEIEDIAAYNDQEGLALNQEEIEYLESLSEKIGRKLTDSEVFGFSQVNSEHCRHKIFNGTFVIDGEEMPTSLFKLIKETSKQHPNGIVSAYKDNVAFVKGPKIQQFAPKSADKPDFYQTKEIDSVLSLKAETHNFPTTVEPFNGAATGSGGEIRDRLAGGKGSLPLAGTAVYMTSYSRLKENRPWEKAMDEREWLYQTPMDILIKASNGASDFGNKFGQPLITGSVLTFEHEEDAKKIGYDKVIMQAGGIGYGKKQESLKDTPKKDDSIVILGGDNYRIGMGGAAVSSADTGEFSNAIELNAIQRSNPEMQKRAANAIRAMVESDENPIVSIHDHGAGGHLNCLSELVEETGGKINMDNLPVGDPTLSAKELIGNESQERMGLVINKKDIDTLHRVADRERAPFYDVGNVTDDHKFTFESEKTGAKPMDLDLEDMFGSSPKTIMNDVTVEKNYAEASYDASKIEEYISQVLKLEAVACKDWLTNKVDRCVTGKVAKQQCAGPLQLPLNNVGVMALDYLGKKGVATSIGHAPVSALINPEAGSKNSIAEALTNLVWAPLEENLKSVSLSANWMWPCKNEGEDARLYKAVKSVSDFAIELGINIPTGKDSLSMAQKYKGETVLAPGTVIISSVGECSDINKVVEPVLSKEENNEIFYIDFSKDAFKLGGSSFGQILNKLGNEVPTIKDASYFTSTFNTIQQLIKEGKLTAGHDISAGGMITALLEMCFADVLLGAEINLNGIKEEDLVKILFAENSGILIQTTDAAYVSSVLEANNVDFYSIGKAVGNSETLSIVKGETTLDLSVSAMRDEWYETSYLLDKMQSGAQKATERFENYKNQALAYKFPANFTGKRPKIDATKPRIKAAIIREKGSNSEREMANAMYMAGFDVKDVHMTDLISGRETLEDIQFIAAVGGFSNSDVLGSAKGWAGAFLYNEKAKTALDNFFKREDTLSLGVCNGCQLFVELGLINPEHDEKPKMLHNDSHKFESIFTSVEIAENNSVMLQSLAGSKLGIWAAHGEGKFHLPKEESKYQIPAKYGFTGYPANPNGSDYNAAMLNSKDGRHLVMMPHLERSTFSWNWGYYPNNTDEVTPWLEAFVNARVWLEDKK